MSETDRRGQLGLAAIRDMLGARVSEAMRSRAASNAFGSELARLGLAYSYGEGWARSALPRRERSLITIAVLIAQRQPDELKNHVRLGLANGLSRTDFAEVLIQLAPYVGLPAAASARKAIAGVLRYAGLDPDHNVDPEEFVPPSAGTP